MPRLPIVIAFCAAACAPIAGLANPPVEVLTVSGEVSIVRGDTGEAQAAAPSATIAAGDYIQTGDAGQLALTIDGQAIRLSSRTQVRVVDVDAGSVELQVAAGNVDLTARSAGGATVDTPTATVRPVRAGSYSIFVSSGGQTIVSAGSGSVTIDGPAGTQILKPGGTVVADASASMRT